MPARRSRRGVSPVRATSASEVSDQRSKAGASQPGELALVNRLLALTRDVPRSYPVTLTAGELLVLLETIAAPPPSTIRQPQ